jgi:CheY-like chemotaxis protein
MKDTHSMQWARAIMIIEDDMDDQELLKETFSNLNYPNPVIFFSNGNDALNYLHQTSAPPAVIISDINMPKMNGLEIRKRICENSELRKLDIPFVFLSTLSESGAVASASCVSDHRFFTKPNTMEGLRNTIKTIAEYWVQPLYGSSLF